MKEVEFTQVLPFANDEYVGFEILWSREGIGFGGMTIYFDDYLGRWQMDGEFMDDEFCAKILADAAPQIIKLARG